MLKNTLILFTYLFFFFAKILTQVQDAISVR